MYRAAAVSSIAFYFTPRNCTLAAYLFVAVEKILVVHGHREQSLPVKRMSKFRQHLRREKATQRNLSENKWAVCVSIFLVPIFLEGVLFPGYNNFLALHDRDTEFGSKTALQRFGDQNAPQRLTYPPCRDSHETKNMIIAASVTRGGPGCWVRRCHI